MPGVRRRARTTGCEQSGCLSRSPNCSSTRTWRLDWSSLHVSQVDLAPAPDRAIWAHAREHGFVIVSKDEDFHRLSVLHGPPPKVIWIRLGNCSTDDVMQLLRMRRDEIEAFVAHEEAAFLALA